MPFIEIGQSPHAPRPERFAELRYGDITVRLSYTFMHHLNTCFGWNDRNSRSKADDVEMSKAVEQITQAMFDDNRKDDHGASTALTASSANPTD